MIEGAIEVELAGEAFVLFPDRAILHQSDRSLILADVHLGKGTAFRHFGLPVPTGASDKDLLRIDRLIEQSNARRLIILGDFVHARQSHDDAMIARLNAWRARQRIDIALVRGNHDRASGRLDEQLRIEEWEEGHREGSFAFAHAPCLIEKAIVFCGHVHPVLSVEDFDGSRVRIPCLVEEAGMIMLPAFGSMTGGHPVAPSPENRIYLFAPRQVRQVRKKT